MVKLSFVNESDNPMMMVQSRGRLQIIQTAVKTIIVVETAFSFLASFVLTVIFDRVDRESKKLTKIISNTTSISRIKKKTKILPAIPWYSYIQELNVSLNENCRELVIINTVSLPTSQKA